jgi:hypothetical protein
MVPGTAEPSVTFATLEYGHGQVRAVASANLSLPLCIWSDSGNKDRPREQNAVDVDCACIRKCRPESQGSGILAVNL